MEGMPFPGSDDGTLRLWEIATGREIKIFRGHTDTVSSVAFSPDGRYALSGSTDKTLKLWEIASGKEIRTLSGHTMWIYSVAFSIDINPPPLVEDPDRFYRSGEK